MPYAFRFIPEGIFILVCRKNFSPNSLQNLLLLIEYFPALK